MASLPFRNITETINEYDLFLFDLWGVIVEGGETYPGVVEAVNEIMTKQRVVFLTNAPRPDFKVAEKLTNWGLHNVVPENILTSGDVARSLIEEKAESLNGKTPVIYHLGSDRNDDILIGAEHVATNNIDEADILLLTIYRDDHEDINEFNDLLEKAAKRTEMLVLCANPDTTIPERGKVRYCAGHFASIIEKFGGKVVYTGKPKKIIYDEVLKRNSDVKPDRILMIGDTFETDILGANKAGIHSALVMTGNANNFHKMHDSMDEKLKALHDRSEKVNARPTFVTKLF